MQHGGEGRPGCVLSRKETLEWSRALRWWGLKRAVFERNVFACKAATEIAVFKWSKTVLEIGL